MALSQSSGIGCIRPVRFPRDGPATLMYTADLTAAVNLSAHQCRKEVVRTENAVCVGSPGAAIGFGEGKSMARTSLRTTDPVRVGQYRLTARLGSGGMGVVYLGADPEGGLVA